MSWWALTAFEREAFGIDPRLLNALVLAHTRYLNMIGALDTEFEDYRTEDRKSFPEFFHGERVYAIDLAMAFMAIACQLPATQTIAWVARAQIQNIRSGLIENRTTAPPWAFGDLT